MKINIFMGPNILLVYEVWTNVFGITRLFIDSNLFTVIQSNSQGLEKFMQHLSIQDQIFFFFFFWHVQFSRNDMNILINFTKKEEARDWRGQKPEKETMTRKPLLLKVYIYCKALLNNKAPRLWATRRLHWLSSRKRPRREMIEPILHSKCKLFSFIFQPGLQRHKDVNMFIS